VSAALDNYRQNATTDTLVLIEDCRLTYPLLAVGVVENDVARQ
jgi:hypothetical protein